MTLATGEKLLTNFTRRSIVDVTGVLDTPPKLKNIKSLKMKKNYNCKIMSATKKPSEINFWGQFPWGRHYSRANFVRSNFLEAILQGAGAFFTGTFFRTPQIHFRIFISWHFLIEPNVLSKSHLKWADW